MNLHEYQGKELFARYALPVLPGQVAGTPEEARDVAASLGGTVVIKAQVQAGGRGKAGGVKLAHSPDEAFEKARDILALTIKGLPVVTATWNAEYDALVDNVNVPWPRWKVK